MGPGGLQDPRGLPAPPESHGLQPPHWTRERVVCGILREAGQLGDLSIREALGPQRISDRRDELRSLWSQTITVRLSRLPAASSSNQSIRLCPEGQADLVAYDLMRSRTVCRLTRARYRRPTVTSRVTPWSTSSTESTSVRPRRKCAQRRSWIQLESPRSLLSATQPGKASRYSAKSALWQNSWRQPEHPRPSRRGRAARPRRSDMKRGPPWVLFSPGQGRQALGRPLANRRSPYRGGSGGGLGPPGVTTTDKRERGPARQRRASEQGGRGGS